MRLPGLFPVFYPESNFAHSLGKDSSDNPHCNGHIAAALASLLDSLLTITSLWPYMSPTLGPLPVSFFVPNS